MWWFEPQINIRFELKNTEIPLGDKEKEPSEIIERFRK